MANVSRVNGFRPVNSLGQEYNARVTKYLIPASDSTATYVGDLVKLHGSASADGTVATVIKAGVGDACMGAVVGFAFDPTDLNLSGTYRVTLTDRYCLVADDPMQLFEVQASGTAAVVGDIGTNGNHADAGGSTTTGQSGETFDMSTTDTTATLALKFMALSSRVDNELAANAKIIVKINNHQYGSHTGTLGLAT